MSSDFIPKLKVDKKFIMALAVLAVAMIGVFGLIGEGAQIFSH